LFSILNAVGETIAAAIRGIRGAASAYAGGAMLTTGSARTVIASREAITTSMK
jgi:hypothetical protein